MIGLTPRQNEVLSFVSMFMDEHGRVAPSYREIQSGLGYSSIENVARILGELEERGHIRRLPNRPRSIEVVGPSQRSVTINASLWPALSRYAASQKIPVDTAASELLREALEAV
jgi:SOS-response transcriptional repressor LexA